MHPNPESPGWTILIPGLPQWYWGQSGRALVLALSFASSIIAGGLSWGWGVAWFLLCFACLTHMASMVDAVHQIAFPSFSPGTAIGATTVLLVSFLYGPVALALLEVAWPGESKDLLGGETGYLVNRLAYRGRAPSPGDCVWLRVPSQESIQAGRILAVGGQEIAWTGRKWRINDKEFVLPRLDRRSTYPAPWKFRVPDGHVLIDPDVDESSAKTAAPLLVVSTGQIGGRAWACYYPFSERRLL